MYCITLKSPCTQNLTVKGSVNCTLNGSTRIVLWKLYIRFTRIAFMNTENISNREVYFKIKILKIIKMSLKTNNEDRALNYDWSICLNEKLGCIRITTNVFNDSFVVTIQTSPFRLYISYSLRNYVLYVLYVNNITQIEEIICDETKS